MSLALPLARVYDPQTSNRSRTIALTLVSLSLTGCNPATKTSLEAWPAEFAQAYCSRGVECGTMGAYPSEAFCVEDERGRLETYYLTIACAVEGGTLRYDGTVMHARVEAIRNATCPEMSALMDVGYHLWDAFGGQVPIDGSCQTSFECRGFGQKVAYCNLTAAPGTCRSTVGEGEVCPSLNACAQGLTCLKAPDDDVQHCYAMPMAGEACAAVAPYCATSAWCVTDNGSSSCVAIDHLFTATLGQACWTPSMWGCQPGLQCAEYPDHHECMNLSPAAAGATCTFGWPDPCPPNQRCVPDDIAVSPAGVCRPLPGGGDACQGTYSCQPGELCDDQVTHQCYTQHVVGEGCSSDDDCYTHQCVAGTCALVHCMQP